MFSHRNLVNLFSDEPYTDGNSPSVVDVWVMWAEAVMRSNDVVRITEVSLVCFFENSQNFHDPFLPSKDSRFSFLLLYIVTLEICNTG